MDFISDAKFLAIGPEYVYMREFDQKRYRTSDFADAGIHMPETIQRSVPKRQAEFLAGRIAARDALQAMGIEADKQIPIGEQRAPVWPQHVVGAISHTDTMAIALTKPKTDGQIVGLDLEKLIDAAHCRSLENMLLTPKEMHRLAVLDAPAAVQLTLTFSAKESLFKAIYPEVRQYLDFLDSEVVAVDTAAQIISLRMTRAVGQTQFRSQYDVHFRRFDNQIATLLI
ncbi:4'-phosphopantetheinyl transferase [Photobacterium sp. 1_MG-2023]|uniref:4'-phosphopantetheinyl transferase family protein n=1 Tax=Photobacterium sp. 1_MG-2023 TaxID=3062646 RepID=UPI0026E28A75|nr:4'-phosphopantetheinyl transferase superfamily protein [Photobacterium sp. 1_MG-2023]MDO6707004.1 4'-phosphopantetheinyl transferase superfamily protein [Photobacterium sp. 1_MG-2023]